jgi:glucosylceramidase
MKFIFRIMIIISIFHWISCVNPTPSSSKARILQTSRAGDKLATILDENLKKETATGDQSIQLDLGKTYQTIYGIGGSFTESSAYVLNQLSAEKRREVIEAYFSSDGAHYTLTRTHINSCDFSVSNYSYAPVPGDTLLKNFSIDEDLNDLIPLIKDAMAAKDASFKIMASPWTAPPWMKDNDNWNAGKLKPEYYQTWALFFTKYINAYQEQGIPIWAVTVENEPLGNGGNWESMHYTPAEMTDFVKNYLGPQFEKDNINTQILIYDQNRDHLEEWASEILGDSAAAKYILGTAIHWYSSTIEWYPETLNKVHNAFPDKSIIHTEGCIDAEVPHWQDDDWYWRKEATDWGWDWAPAEDKHLHPKYAPVYRYARDLIGTMNSSVAGWIDWNIVLDHKGGPNHANNWCIAPVIANTDSNQVYYTPLYYVMCHFSKYIRPGARRIDLKTDIDNLMMVACKNEDNSIIVNILNQSGNEIPYTINLAGKSVSSTISGSALQTVIIY